MKLWPSIGTRSVLWGVHAFWFHPFVVWIAWHQLYKRFPNRWECLAIFSHDLAYCGKKSMDGPDGKLHPYGGALIGKRIARLFGASEVEASFVEFLILGHSRSFCQDECKKLSDLCDPDKLSILYDPAWFYWLRGTLSGEIKEYREREEERQGRGIPSTWAWLSGYRNFVKARFSKI
jgi:hypothetical protein